MSSLCKAAQHCMHHRVDLFHRKWQIGLQNNIIIEKSTFGTAVD